MVLPAVAVTGMLLAGCAGAPVDADDAQEPGSGGTYAAFTTILQAAEDGAPELCLGGVMESYPPQCRGPEVVGLDWEDVADAETASGVTWGTGWVVGIYDAGAGVFTLTEPVSDSAPQGLSEPSPAAPSGEGAADADILAAQDALHEALPEVLGSGGSGGILEVTVILADDATTQAVLDVVAPWLGPDQVVVSGVLIAVE